jgi:hypothetical protein
MSVKRKRWGQAQQRQQDKPKIAQKKRAAGSQRGPRALSPAHISAGAASFQISRLLLNLLVQLCHEVIP